MATSTTAVQMFRVGDIRPNPYRDLKRYPLREATVQALRESIRTTFFWGNVVARIGEEGKPELAYGHHRLEAVRQELGEDSRIPLTVRKLSDEMMLKILVRENREEFHTDALMLQASIRAVVEAYAAGDIELRRPEPKTPKKRLRYAPSFRQGDVAGRDRQDRPYTVGSVAAFLGWDRTKVESTLSALELIERDMVTEEHYRGLNQRQANVLTNTVRNVISNEETRARKFEDEAADLREVAERTASDDERTFAEQQADAAEREAASIREGLRTRSQYGSFCAYLQYTDVPGRDEALAEFLATRKPPRESRKKPEWNDSMIVNMYVKDLGLFSNGTRRMLPYAERMTQEQMLSTFEGVKAVEAALASLQEAIRDALRERAERGAIPDDLAEQMAETQKRRQQPRAASGHHGKASNEGNAA